MFPLHNDLQPLLKLQSVYCKMWWPNQFSDRKPYLNSQHYFILHKHISIFDIQRKKETLRVFCRHFFCLFILSLSCINIMFFVINYRAALGISGLSPCSLKDVTGTSGLRAIKVWHSTGRFWERIYLFVYIELLILLEHGLSYIITWLAY